MSSMDAVADAAGLAFTLAIISNLVYYGVAITMYVLHSLGLYTIAKRRELTHPWMAWVPGLQLWTLGSIADQYMYVAKDKVRNRRKWVVGLAIAMAVLMVVFYIVFFAAYFVFFLEISMNMEMGMVMEDELQFVLNGLKAFVPTLVVFLLMFAVSIVLSVVEYVCYYKLFASCDPENKTLFLVLSIFFSFLLPIFVFVCRKKDMGMPPRRDAQPTYIPQAAYVPPTAYAPQADAAPVAPVPQTAPDAPTPPVPSAIMSWGDPVVWAEASAQENQSAAQPEQPPVQPEPPVEITGNTQ